MRFREVVADIFFALLPTHFPTQKITVDRAGNLSQFTDRRGKITTHTYDGLNQRTFAGFGTIFITPPSYESSITYSYDAGNRLTSVVDSAAGTITPSFDNLDRLTSEVTSQGTVSYAYDAANRRTSQTVTGQTAVNYTYDDANRLTQITRGTPTVSFAYDNANRRTSLTLPNGIVMSYSYDNSSELTGITYTNGSTTLGTLTYGYDLAGRSTSMGGSYARIALPLGVSEAEYNANNQLTEWGTASLFYDANGNITSDGVNSYTWNARNQLASMNFGANSFRYDAYGRRVTKTISSTTTNYLYDGANILQELSGTTPTANLLSGGIDEVFTRTDSNGTANFLTDALGSAINLTDSSANSLVQYGFEPFGNTFVTSGSSANPFQYTGRENDGTGLYFNRARYFNPTLQRFISEDPRANASDIDFYAYAANDPVLLRDPSGLNPSPGRSCSACGFNPLRTVGLSISGLAAAGAGPGGGTVATASGGFANSSTSTQWVATGGAATSAGNFVQGSPANQSSNGQIEAGAYGAFVGGGLTATFSNGEPSDLQGQFKTINVDLGFLLMQSASISLNHRGIFQISLSVPGLSYGIGASMSFVHTNTAVSGP